jgi:hypothetical protein
MPPSGFSKPVVDGALRFIGGCYQDLLEEIKSGKHASLEEAIGYELSQIKKALDSIHISDNGQLVDRRNSDEPMVLK